MATNPSTLAENALRITAPDANYTYGSAQDDSTGTTGDGTPIKKAVMNDMYGLQQALLRAAGIVPSGSADTQLASQYMQAIVELAAGRAVSYDESGAADAYVLDLRTNQQGPAGYYDGMPVEFDPGNVCTAGGVTFNVAALGLIDVKLRGGLVDPAAGDILPGQTAKAVYRSSPSAHFELSRAGRVITTVITATNAAWARQPDAGDIEFDVVGAGGGGGGCDGQGAGTGAASGGGGSGCRGVKTAPALDDTYNITIGAGGAKGTGNVDGTAGTASSVVDNGPGTNVNVSAPGGSGGKGSLGSAAFAVAIGGGTGSATGADHNIKGGSGEDGLSVDYYLTIAHGGSLFGTGTRGGNQNNAGAPSNYGDGGGGCTIAATTANASGGNGGDGVVIVTEYLH